MKYLIYALAICTLFISCQDNESDTDIQISTKTIEQIVEVEQPEIVTQDNPNISGEFIERFPNGNVKTEGWNNKDGKRDKTWYSYYENGVKWSESIYSNGLKEGVSKVYYANGKMRYTGFYTADEKSGHWTFYNEAGEIEKEENY